MNEFLAPTKSIRWARESFKNALDAFTEFGAIGFKHTVENNLETHEHVLKFCQISDTPDTVEREFGSSLRLLRDSFDQSMFAACAAIGKPIKKINFPWSDNPDPDLEHRMSDGRNKKGVPEELKDAIRRQQPYPSSTEYDGGNSLVRNVARLVNNKHSIGFEIEARPVGVAFKNMKFSGGAVSMPAMTAWDHERREIEYLRASIGIDATIPFPDMAIQIFFSDKDTAGRINALDAIPIFANYAEYVMESLKEESYRINSRQ